MCQYCIDKLQIGVYTVIWKLGGILNVQLVTLQIGYRFGGQTGLKVGHGVLETTLETWSFQVVRKVSGDELQTLPIFRSVCVLLSS